LLEDYLKEFEKMAEIITTNDDFTEETIRPFEVDMTADMLTVPLTTIAHDEHRFALTKTYFKTIISRGGIWEIGRTAKDWVAEQVTLVTEFTTTICFRSPLTF
jgi:hypothetical protein